MAHIRIIDDDADFADNIAGMLRKAGHTVSVQNTTQNAVQILLDTKPDLLILDVMFPDNPMAGFDLARKIRRSKPIKALPIILLTSVNKEFPMDFSPADIDADWMPVHDFVEKPSNAAIILEKIDKLLKPK